MKRPFKSWKQLILDVQFHYFDLFIHVTWSVKVRNRDVSVVWTEKGGSVTISDPTAITVVIKAFTSRARSSLINWIAAPIWYRVSNGRRKRTDFRLCVWRTIWSWLSRRSWPRCRLVPRVLYGNRRDDRRRSDRRDARGLLQLFSKRRRKTKISIHYFFESGFLCQLALLAWIYSTWCTTNITLNIRMFSWIWKRLFRLVLTTRSLQFQTQNMENSITGTLTLFPFPETRFAKIYESQ